MDLQAAHDMKGKRGLLSKLTVAFCLMLTGALLVGSLVSPSRANHNDKSSSAPAVRILSPA